MNIVPFYESKLVERILSDQQGRRFRVLILFFEDGHEIKARILSAIPIDQILSLNGTVSNNYCLSCAFSSIDSNDNFFVPFRPVISPYFSLEHLISSQPTRAPALSA